MFEHLLLSKLNMFEGLNLLVLAEKGKCKRFLSTEAVKQYVNDLWTNGYYSFDNLHIKPLSLLKTWFFTLTLGLFAPCFVYEQKEIDTSVENAFKGKTKLFLSPKNHVNIHHKRELKEVTYFEKFKCFHSRPSTRFFYDNVS